MIKQVVYRFYKKPVSSNLVMMEHSAMLENIRAATISQEVIRRLSHCSQDTPTSEKVEILDKLTVSMLRSGYSTSQIIKYVTAGLRGYSRKVRQAQVEGRPSIHRLGATGAAIRKMDKITLKGTWYKTSNQDGQATGGTRQTGRGGVRPYKIKRGEKKTPLTCMFIPRSRGGLLAVRSNGHRFESLPGPELPTLSVCQSVSGTSLTTVRPFQQCRGGYIAMVRVTLSLSLIDLPV